MQFFKTSSFFVFQLLHETMARIGVRNALLRGVENVICIQLMDSSFYAEIKGVKDDYTYYTKKDKPEDVTNVDFEAIELDSSRFKVS